MFEELIKNKRVVFVGPSIVLLGKKRKDFINSFDVIIKTNGLGFISTDLYNDYGDKCDILYVNHSFLKYSDMNTDHLLSIDVKMVCVKAIRHMDRFDMSPIPIRAMRKIENSDFLCAPIMGSLIINDVLSENPESLHLMGLDFYSNEQDYVETYQPPEVHEIIEKRKKKENTKINSVHNVNDDLIYTYDKVKSSGIITVDSNIKKLFEEYESRSEKV
jgi:hypothetical protein